MEKLLPKKIIRGTLLAGIGVLGLSACAPESTGQVEPPTIEEIREGGEFFELQRPDGTKMVCWSFGARGDGLYGESPSWFSVTCDWDGDYVGGTTTTSQPQTIDTING
jgi:hypothetical protein